MTSARAHAHTHAALPPLLRAPQYSAAVAGAGAGLLTSARAALRSGRPSIALVSAATMAAVTAVVERARVELMGGGSGGGGADGRAV